MRRRSSRLPAAVAALIVMLQAAAIGALVLERVAAPAYQTAGGEETAGEGFALLVGFSDAERRSGEITDLLKRLDAVVTDGPKAGLYRLRFPGSKAGDEEGRDRGAETVGDGDDRAPRTVRRAMRFLSLLLAAHHGGARRRRRATRAAPEASLSCRRRIRRPRTQSGRPRICPQNKSANCDRPEIAQLSRWARSESGRNCMSIGRANARRTRPASGPTVRRSSGTVPRARPANGRNARSKPTASCAAKGTDRKMA